ncbi:hypothetical protein SAMN05216249_101149 [Acetitomaculum ruminis DSM 5522]|uniref:Uncharacterized protein n=1 Tax=Acetitomaculum ruminis DSM 5522 TaxID=1120918 RepID=A0A1I0V463_9FIRM|nr:hypothetical protein [Acetitomaculum ruminis]SFA71052.1 hypothetical protein SAMN05216249_101149 [Acetitomaculum ruminis DSM 5522]
MLDKIDFFIGNDNDGYMSINVRVYEFNIMYTVEHSKKGVLTNTKTISAGPRTENILKSFNNLNVDKWLNNYEHFVLKRTKWQLKYKKKNGVEYLKKGINAYPDDFAELLDWFNELAPEANFSR